MPQGGDGKVCCDEWGHRFLKVQGPYGAGFLFSCGERRFTDWLSCPLLDEPDNQKKKENRRKGGDEIAEDSVERFHLVFEVED